MVLSGYNKDPPIKEEICPVIANISDTGRPKRMKKYKTWKEEEVRTRTADMSTPFLRDINTLSSCNLSCRSSEKSRSATERMHWARRRNTTGRREKSGIRGGRNPAEQNWQKSEVQREQAQRVTVRDEVVPLSTCALSKSPEIQPYRLSPTE